MIAVIADDFTGAAEIAGIALRYGLQLIIQIGSVCKMDASVLNGADGVIICTDSRSMPNEEAIKITTEAVSAILQLNPSFVYKKIDSVLRGYVIDEVQLQMHLTGKKKAMILPANPSLKRTISNGEYHIDGKRITETDFVNDPEFPVTSSFISKMLTNDEVKIKRLTEQLPEKGMVIGEIATTDDVDTWANKADDTWMLAGAGDFFSAIMRIKFSLQQRHKPDLRFPFLYVSGTSFDERKQYISTINKHTNYVSYLPDTITNEWLAQTSAIIQKHQRLIIAIKSSAIDACKLRKEMARAVKILKTKNEIKEIFIEGGSTAAAVLSELDANLLHPVDVLSRGVVRMKSNDLFITVKPGSYELPEEIKKIIQE